MLKTTLGGRYSIISRLGAGGFGETYLAEDVQLPDNHCCVVKHLKPQTTDSEILDIARRLFTSEAKVLHKLGTHDQIPRLLANFEENQEFYLVQEFIEGHGLDRELPAGKKWDQTKVVNLLQDILTTLGFVHQQKVIHRDIKPENLIRRKQDGKLILIDFGAVKQVCTQIVTSSKRAKSTITIGTSGYMPSEQANGYPHVNSDIYAVGVIGIQALTGLDPEFIPKNPNTLELEWSHLVEVSPDLVKILDKMVRFDFRQRYPSTTAVLADLEAVEINPNLPSLNLANSPTEITVNSRNLPTEINQNTTSTLSTDLTTEIEISPNLPSLNLANSPTEITVNSQNLPTEINQNTTSTLPTSLATEIEISPSGQQTNQQNQPTQIISGQQPNQQNQPPQIISGQQTNQQNLSGNRFTNLAKNPDEEPTAIYPKSDLKPEFKPQISRVVIIGSAIALLAVISSLAINRIYQVNNVGVETATVDNQSSQKKSEEAEAILLQVKVLDQLELEIKSGSDIKDIETLALKIPETSPLRNKVDSALVNYKKQWEQDKLAVNEANAAFKEKNWKKALNAYKKIVIPYWKQEARWIATKAETAIAPKVPKVPPRVIPPRANPRVISEPVPTYTPPIAPSRPSYTPPPAPAIPAPSSGGEKFSIPEAQ